MAFNDPSSQSNYPSAKVTHTEFDLLVDFSAKEITGTVTLSVILGGGGGDPPATLVLDTNALTIEKCTVDGACGPRRTIRVCRYFQKPVKILDVLRWAREHGCQWDTELCLAAASSNRHAAVARGVWEQ